MDYLAIGEVTMDDLIKFQWRYTEWKRMAKTNWQLSYRMKINKIDNRQNKNKQLFSSINKNIRISMKSFQRKIIENEYEIEYKYHIS